MSAFRLRHLAVAAGAIVVLAHGTTAHALFTSTEGKCSKALAKSIEKYNAAILKEVSRCHADDVSGKADDDDACATLPAKGADKLATARQKMLDSVAKACKSVCNISTGISCTQDVGCPPNNASAERCIGKGGTARFNIHSLGFPGPYCGALLGDDSMRGVQDAGLCAAGLTERLSDLVIDNLYGSLDEDDALSKDAQKCLSSITKAATKSLSKMHSAVAKCQTGRQVKLVCDGGSDDGETCANNGNCQTGRCGRDPDECIDDPVVAASVQKEADKVRSAVSKSCKDADIAAIPDLCSSGGVSPATVAQAQDCLAAMVREIGAEQHGPYAHTYSTFGLINVSHPPTAFGYCGDGLVDQVRNESNRIGEECDGDADSACGAGECLPPGDMFECTCDNVARYRMVVDGDMVDSDAGWKGDSHDATHNDNFGYTAELSNCNCSDFTQGSCTGTSTDDICDFDAKIGPRCTNNFQSEDTCDDTGDGDGDHEDADCFVCDDNSLNPGVFCADGDDGDESICLSQCFVDATGLPAVPTDACNRQSDCPLGQTCKGRCDTSPTCEAELEGSPLPQVSAGISVCIGLEYTSDLTGTKNMRTGESELFYTSRSVVHLGEVSTRPCPVCEGRCVGGSKDGFACQGRCNASAAECIFDSDCTGVGDTTCLESAADCPSGSCSLDLRCSSGSNDGGFCRPMANTPLGIVSADCPPDPADNLSGIGVQQPFGAVTTEPIQFPAGGACSDPAFSNLTCPCPDGGTVAAVKTKPNLCAATCDDGVNEGQPCAVTPGGSGTMTKCFGGLENGAICDEDDDCSGGGTCSTNPTHCTAGGPATLQQPCSTNAQCDTSLGSADGVCADACPGARCLPLCFQQGSCSGGARNGLECARDVHCTGGGTCVAGDPEEGLCANGPFKWRCTGAGYTTLPCSLLYEHTQRGCEIGPDGVAGNSDDIPGAGFCESKPQDCYINNGATEGWDTINGNGDASEVKLVSTFCTPPAGVAAVNEVSGFGGPSRTRRFGSGFVNVDSIP